MKDRELREGTTSKHSYWGWYETNGRKDFAFIPSADSQIKLARENQRRISAEVTA